MLKQYNEHVNITYNSQQKTFCTIESLEVKALHLIKSTRYLDPLEFRET